MNFIKEIPAMRWKEGKYEEVMEKTVQDENIVFHIDDLPPRKFSTYPEDLDDFISLIRNKYEFRERNMSICKILEDIITGKIKYEIEIK